jgi:dipeptidyl aminopeptidase/acylaminoacyl peptidase
VLNRITRGPWLVRDILAVDEKSRQIYFTGGGREPGNPYHRYLYRIKLDGSGLTLLSPERGDHPVVPPEDTLLTVDSSGRYDALSPTGRYIGYGFSTVDQPPVFIVRSTKDIGQSRIIERADVSALQAAGYQVPEEISVKAADGKTDLWGVLYRPANFDPARKYPVIDAEYASPLVAATPRNYVTGATGGILGYATPASLAQLGFVVVAVDARSTPLRAREFSQAGFGRLNINGMDDHVAAIKNMAARFPFMDVSRVGVTGLSYGGFSALRAMLEFPDFFKVGVAGVPPANMLGMYSDFHFWGFQGLPVYSNGGEWRPSPAEEPKNWHQLSVSPDIARRLRGKLLIVMGEFDEFVLPGSVLQLVHAFIDADRDFDLLYMPGTSHASGGTMTPYVTRRTWSYFVRNLSNQEPPGNDAPAQAP